VGVTATGTARPAMPQAILTQDVEQLGERGEVVDVSKGYLRNFLIPRKLAEPATKGSIEAARRRKEAADRAVADAETKAREGAELLNRTVLTIAHQAGEDGRLFGAVTAQDIADAIKEARGITIDRRDVHLEEPIKTVGTRMVDVEVSTGVTASVKTMVVEQK
jgi:large subunit ribosomal protein L9